MSDTQTVVDETNAAATQAATETSARPEDQGESLDAILSSYEEETKPKPITTEQTTETKPPARDPAIAQIEQRFFRQDMDNLVKTVRGDIDPDLVDDEMIESWVDAQARKDPRLQQAWLARNENPKQFERVAKELGKSFAKKFSNLPDKRATEDREAVTAAVRSATTKAPEGKAPDFSQMSNQEFRDAHKKEYGYYPPV